MNFCDCNSSRCFINNLLFEECSCEGGDFFGGSGSGGGRECFKVERNNVVVVVDAY